MADARDRTNAGSWFPDFSDLASNGRIAAGIGCIVLGVLLTWLLWVSGWYWGYATVLVPVGIGLVLSGLGDLRRQRAARAEWRRARAEREEILAALDDARQHGTRPVDWLQEHGFRAPRVRRYLLDHLRRRRG